MLGGRVYGPVVAPVVMRDDRRENQITGRFNTHDILYGQHVVSGRLSFVGGISIGNDTAACFLRYGKMENFRRRQHILGS